MKWFYNFADNNPKKWHLIKALTSIIPGLLLAYIAIKWNNNPLPYQDSLRVFFEDHLVLTLVCIIVPLGLPHLFSLVDKGVIKFLDAEVKNKLITASLVLALDEIVGNKMRRIHAYVKKMGPTPTRADAFSQTVQPEQHFIAILNQLYNLLQQTTVDNSIEVVLVRISSAGLPYEYTAHVPTTNQLPNELIENHAIKSMFCYCARVNSAILIPDIEKHLELPANARQYHPTGNPDHDRGSILCKPLYCEYTKNVEFVLSIKSDVANVINEEFKRIYKIPLNSMASRLLLEHYFAMIKERAI